MRLEDLNDSQKRAVKYTDGALLIIAGAGSGKTRVLTNRIAYLIEECGVDPYNIMAITFTNKAAAELKTRLVTMLGEDGNDIWASTFHSMCARILRRDGERLGYTNRFTIYDTDDSRRLMKDCCKALNIEEKILPAKAILSEISRAKDQMIDANEYLRRAGTDTRKGTIGKAYQMYQERLKAADAMDFDDMICKTVELLQKNTGNAAKFGMKFGRKIL